ncbi:MAG TPA: SDR family oxidoreductase [Spirochaetota bacterium]|nr:SDR family oxidoreductase [Spirochaetota bacterium]
MKSLINKNIIITGAGSGIGRLMALRFAAESSNLALVDINAAALKALKDDIGKKGLKISVNTYTCDISDRTAVSRTVAGIMRDFTQVDVLINNAGMVIGKAFLDLSLEEFHRTMDVNFWGHLYFTKAVLPGMTARNSGNIVNVASSSGLLGMPLLSDYAASKFAEVGFSEALRRELKKFGHGGVKITCVCPYIIDTGMFRGFKPMLLSPFVKPDRAAARIVRAVKKDHPYVMLPAHSIRGMMFLKLLPTAFFDWMLKMSGGDSAMDVFTGRP